MKPLTVHAVPNRFPIPSSSTATCKYADVMLRWRDQGASRTSGHPHPIYLISNATAMLTLTSIAPGANVPGGLVRLGLPRHSGVVCGLAVVFSDESLFGLLSIPLGVSNWRYNRYQYSKQFDRRYRK